MNQLYKIIIILFFICFKSYSQEKEEAIMYFKDGDSIEGFAYLKFNKIKFQIAPDEKLDTWDEEFVKKIKFTYNGDPRTFEYVKLNSIDKPKLVEIVTEGGAILYKKLGSDYSVTDQIYNPHDRYATTKNPSGEPIFGNNQPLATPEYYYIKKEKDKYPTCLNCGVINAWRNKTAKVFSDCDFIVKKLKGDKWIFDDIIEIVEFYNDICLGE